MIAAATDTIPGQEISNALKLALGDVVQAKQIGCDVVANLRGLAGGKARELTESMAEACVRGALPDCRSLDPPQFAR